MLVIVVLKSLLASVLSPARQFKSLELPVVVSIAVVKVYRQIRCGQKARVGLSSRLRRAIWREEVLHGMLETVTT